MSENIKNTQGSDPFLSGVPELSPGNLMDNIQLVFWYFFDPASLEAYRQRWDGSAIRRLAALPVSFLIWFPLAIPILAIDLGVASGWNGITLFALNAAIPFGCLVTSFLGRKTFRQGFGLSYLLGLLLLVGLIWLVVYHEFSFVVITISQLGWKAGGVVVGVFLLAIVLATAIAWSLGVNISVLVLFIAGGFAGDYLLASLGIEEMSSRSYFFTIGVSALLLFGPAFGLAKLLERLAITLVRLMALSLIMVVNSILVWMLIFEGWYFLQQVLG